MSAKKYLLAVAVLALALSACATARWSEGAIPSTSAASPSAEAAPSRPMGTALQEEPPLPGESVERWPGLEEQPSSVEGTHGAP